LKARNDECGNDSCSSFITSWRYIWYIPSRKTSVQKQESKTADGRYRKGTIRRNAQQKHLLPKIARSSFKKKVKKAPSRQLDTLVGHNPQHSRKARIADN